MKKALLLFLFSATLLSCKKEIICNDFNVNNGTECISAHNYFVGEYSQNTPPDLATIEAGNTPEILIFNRSNDCTGQYATVVKDNAASFYFLPQTYQANGFTYEILSGSGSYNGTVLNYTLQIKYNGQTVDYNFTGTRL